MRAKAGQLPTQKSKILELLDREGRLNTRQVAIHLGLIYQCTRTHLYELRMKKFVEDEYVKRFVPGLYWILMHEWWITDAGREWLKRQRR